MAKRIAYDEDAREALLRGVRKFSEAVKSTLGPRGRHAILDRGWGAPNVTKDGATVAEEVELSDAVENLGATMLRQAATKVADQAGDGSTTATVLAEAIYTRGLRNIMAGANPVSVQRGLNRACERVLAALDKQAVAVEKSGLAHVAAIAANNSIEIGKVIADALSKVGGDGVVTIDEGKGVDTDVKIVDGMQFDRGYLSQYFVNDEDAAAVVLRDPYVLILEEKVSNLGQIVPIMEKVLAKKKPLLIIAEDIEGEALSTLVVNQKRGVLNCAAIKAPGYGERRKAMLADIAAVTGGTPIFKDLGIEPGSIQMRDLGSAKRVEITSGTTTIIRGAGKKADIEDRVRQIRMEIEHSTSDYDTEKLQERLARLIGGIAEIQVGGGSEAEVKEKKKRFENALNATRSAVEEGIVPGGGIAFVNAYNAVEALRTKDADERVGVEILAAALEAPFRQLAANAGEEPSRLLRDIRNTEDPHMGYDFEKLEIRNLIDAGIIDPVKTLKISLQNAVSVAGMLFTTEAVITEIPKPEAAHDHDHDDEMAGMGGMGGMPGMGMGGMGGMGMPGMM